MIRALLRAGACVLVLSSAVLLPMESFAQMPQEPPRHPDRDWAARLHVHGGAFSAKSDRTIDPSLGYSLEGSARFGALGLTAEVGHHCWPSLEWDWSMKPGVLTAALGGEFLYAGGRLRSSIALGTATLLYNTGFGHKAGATGPFVHLIPIAVRVPFGQHVTAELRPLSWMWTVISPRDDLAIIRNDIVFSIGLEVGS